MYWYGWLVTSLLGAIAVSLVSYPIVRRASTQFWLGWVVPIVVGVIFLYLFCTEKGPRRRSPAPKGMG